jgi:uncharacterized protein
MASYTVELPSGRRPLTLGKPLGEGAAGIVFQLLQMTGYAAKIYKDPREAAQYQKKIATMLECVPDLGPVGEASASCHQIAWPATRVFDGRGAFIGFTMPEIDFDRSRPLESILQKNSRRADGISERYELRVVVAANLATVFTELHRLRHHMIDMKPDNLRFYPDFGYLAVVDTDGFSIRGPLGRFPAHQVTDNYVAPEGRGRRPDTMGLGQDLFALAVILFQLLNNGLHPFGGVVSHGAGLPSDLQSRIYANLYAYGRTPHDHISPSPISIHEYFDDSTRRMFDRAFLAAGGRPSAKEWRDHLQSLLRGGGLITCRVNPRDHAHFGKGCGLCAVEKKLQGARNAKASQAGAAAPGRSAQMAVKPPPASAYTPPAPPPPPPRPARPAFASPTPGGVPWAVKAAGWGFGLLLAISMVRSCIADLGTKKIVATPVAAASGPAVSWFGTPAAYVVTPKAGISRVNLRSGPGGEYPSLLMLPRGRVVTGRGSASASDGELWIFVRTSGGTEGFMADKVLRLQDSAPASVDASYGNPSFSCTGDLNWVERTICQDADLAAKDREVASLYHRVFTLSVGAKRQEVTDVQRNWLKDRDRCGGSGDVPACINSEYDRRIAALRDWSPPASIRTPVQTATDNNLTVSKNRGRGSAGTATGRATPQPSLLVTCVLPSGEEAKMSQAQCRQSAGVIYSN